MYMQLFLHPVVIKPWFCSVPHASWQIDDHWSELLLVQAFERLAEPRVSCVPDPVLHLVAT
jgi:hypothetical protein